MSKPRDCRPDRPEARMGYVNWHLWADRKVQQGHKSRWCTKCERFKFKSERCDDFVDGTEDRLRELGLEGAV